MLRGLQRARPPPRAAASTLVHELAAGSIFAAIDEKERLERGAITSISAKSQLVERMEHGTSATLIRARAVSDTSSPLRRGPSGSRALAG